MTVVLLTVGAVVVVLLLYLTLHHPLVTLEMGLVMFSSRLSPEPLGALDHVSNLLLPATVLLGRPRCPLPPSPLHPLHRQLTADLGGVSPRQMPSGSVAITECLPCLEEEGEGEGEVRRWKKKMTLS